MRSSLWRRTQGSSLVAQAVKNLPAMQDTWVWFLGLEDPLEKGMVTYSSFLAWRIPGIEEPGGLQPWGPKASDMTKGLTLSLFPRKLRESDPFVILDSYVSKTVMEFLYKQFKIVATFLSSLSIISLILSCSSLALPSEYLEKFPICHSH